MNRYETTFILNSQADDATIDRQVKAVSDIITTNGGAILHEDRMGTRRLAYEIAGLTQGYYMSFIFEAPAGVLPLLERHYKLEEPYVRHLTVIFDADLEAVKKGPSLFESVFERPDRGEADGGRRDGRRGHWGDRDNRGGGDRWDRGDRGGRDDRGDHRPHDRGPRRFDSAPSAPQPPRSNPGESSSGSNS